MSEIIEMHCVHCDTTVRIAEENLLRIARYAQLRSHGKDEITLSLHVLDGVDLTEPADAATIARVARAMMGAAARLRER